MMNRVIKRMQRAQLNHAAATGSSSSQRPTLTRGNKSYSDSTMETVTSDQNSIPSNSTRNNNALRNCRNHSNNSNNSDGSCRNNHCNEEISEDDFSSHPDQTTTTTTTTTPSSSCHSSATAAPKSENDSSTHNNTTRSKRTSAVCFASDYDSPPEIIASTIGDTLTEEEVMDCFYSTTELNSFDRDRALTVLMYQTRNKSVLWDDNEHSLRGLEEYTGITSSDTCDCHSKSSTATSSRRTTRKELIQAVLNEQTRLRDMEEGRKEVAQASKMACMTPEELIRELLRGVSCSLSKCDKQRAIQYAQKDEKEVNAYNPKWKDPWMSTNQYYNHVTSIMNQFTPNSRRRYLSMVKNKINDWSNTSNKSISSTGTCGDRSTTSSTCGNHSHEHVPQTHSQEHTSSSRSGGITGRMRTRTKLSRNNSNDSVTNDNHHEDTDDKHNSFDDDDDDVDDDDDHNEVYRHTVARQPPSSHRQQQQRTLPTPIRYKDTSPLSIIQQVVYETSKEFEYDHNCNSSSGSNGSNTK